MDHFCPHLRSNRSKDGSPISCTWEPEPSELTLPFGNRPETMQEFLSFVSNHWELFLALAVIVALLIYQYVGSGGSKSLSPQEATALINRENAVVLDVREPAEVKTGKILNSLTIPLGQLAQRLDKLQKYKDTPLIVVCQSGSRSARACSLLRKKGFSSVYNLRGGIMAWSNAGLPLSKK